MLCLLRSKVTTEDYLRDSRHRRHTHISVKDADVLLERGLVEWVEIRKGLSVLRRIAASDNFRFDMRGLSSRVGAPIAMAVERLLCEKAEGRRVKDADWGWALVMLRQIQTRRPQSSRTFKRWRKEG